MRDVPIRAIDNLRRFCDMSHRHVVHLKRTAHLRFDTMLEVKLEKLVELLNADYRVFFPPHLLELLFLTLHLDLHVERLEEPLLAPWPMQLLFDLLQCSEQVLIAFSQAVGGTRGSVATVDSFDIGSARVLVSRHAQVLVLEPQGSYHMDPPKKKTSLCPTMGPN